MSRIIKIKSVFFLLCALTLAACESDGDNMVIVSHEDQVEVLTEAELYKVDNDAIQHDSLKTELGNGLADPVSYKKQIKKLSSDIADGNHRLSEDAKSLEESEKRDVRKELNN